MKKIASIFFLVLILGQVAGSYIYFISRLVSIRQEMRGQLKEKSDEDLSKFTFTLPEFEKVKVEDNEIRVAGKMYDVARIQSAGNKVVVFALADDAEDGLLSFLDTIVKRSAKDKKPVPTQLSLLYSTPFLITPALSIYNSYSTFKHLSFYYCLQPSFIKSILSPPPR